MRNVTNLKDYLFNNYIKKAVDEAKEELEDTGDVRIQRKSDPSDIRR